LPHGNGDNGAETEGAAMPLSSAQLAALVERARLKAPPVVTPSQPAPTHPTTTAPDPPAPAPQPEPVAAPPPDGWQLKKESWHFHRRFYAIFKRPMECGEYSHLLWQVRRGKAEHLWEDCWRVTLPNGGTLPIRATIWRLITILPKRWQPPQVAPVLSNIAVATAGAEVAAEEGMISNDTTR
jgi:hypothetical protein